MPHAASTMKEVDVQLPTTLNAGAVEATVESIAREAVLTVTMKDTLKKFPGCVHWHLKRGKELGVLEVTWWPDGGKKRASRLWFSAHGNRQAAWMLDLTPTLKRKIEVHLAANG